MDYTYVKIAEPAGHIRTLTLHRPEAANALNTQMAEELTHALTALPATCRAVILTGAGDRAFCAGADLKERNGMDEAAWEAQHSRFRAARDALLNAPVPVIAAVNGAAFGGGCELALACDFIYAADHARFALPEASLGIMPGMGGTQTLPRAAGAKRALELLLTGAPFSAQNAYDWGMANHVVPAERLAAETLAAAERIAANAPLSVAAIRRAVRNGAALPLENALSVEMTEYAPLLATQDRQEGIAAYNEKRKPVFTGE